MRSVTEKLPAGQPFVVRVIHWLNLISLFGMITSGLQIYNANPVFGGREGRVMPHSTTSLRGDHHQFRAGQSDCVWPSGQTPWSRHHCRLP